MGAPKTAPRTSYHHGDLRNALMDSAVDLARLGGPAAVVLREVARRVGVSATAAYRYFSAADELLDEVKHAALARLAEWIEKAVDAVPADGDPADVALARLRASAEGYLDFAFAEPGLFQTAFCRDDLEHPEEDEPEDFSDAAAFQIFSRLLDEVVLTGGMSEQCRVGAEIAGWSTVHGFAVLSTEGPLGRHLPPEVLAFVRKRTIDVLMRGLTRAE
ncbi:TetR/AcrR family transcriptional regulator [Catenulispora yoronensis]|uniref:TetR/AcrR family transcriptional regulator n=1 Tax=Catenulispora yoronensis TaxID=450799 RepID=A0ABP5FPX9_9ACTN